MGLLLNKKGQYTLEYAVLIGVIAVALAALQIYVKKCKQGDLRDAGEQIGDPFGGAGTTVTTSNSSYTENIAGKISRTNVSTSSNTSRTGN